MPLEVSDRTAVETDFDFIWSLYNESVKSTVSQFITWRDEEQQARFKESLDLSIVRIAVLGDQPIAWFALGESDSSLDLEQLFIIEKYRRKGLGRGIAAWAKSLASEKKLTFRLPTLDAPSAVAFATSLGLSGERLDQITLIFS